MKAKRRTAQRGAIFVEAIIVCVVIITAFVGITFFKKMYVGKQRVARLSRAATLHYAIIGCQGNVNGELSVIGGAGTTNGLDGNDVSYGSNPTAGASSQAQTAAGSQAGVSSLGAKIVHIQADGDVSASGAGQGYTTTTNTTSWVGCADPVVPTGNEWDDIIPKALSAISL